MARRAAERLPQIRRIILFGSLVNGTPTPRSDADLFVEMTEADDQDPRDRAANVIQAMSPLACAVDVFVYSSAELESGEAGQSPVVTLAQRNGIDLLR